LTKSDFYGKTLSPYCRVYLAVPAPRKTMKRSISLLALGLFGLLLAGCGGGGVSTGSDGGSTVTTDAPLSATGLTHGMSGSATLRSANGFGMSDHPVTLKYVHDIPDDGKYGLIETGSTFLLGPGFSGSPLIVNGQVVGGVSYGYANSDYDFDNLHADCVSLKDIFDEYNGVTPMAKFATGGSANKVHETFYVPAGLQPTTSSKWATTKYKFANIDTSQAPGASRQALTPGGQGYVSQGMGLAFMYSPYLYATGTATVKHDNYTWLTLCHGILDVPGDANLLVCRAYTYTMNNGTHPGIPDVNQFVGTATKSLMHSTVVKLQQQTATYDSHVVVMDTNGTTQLTDQSVWFVRGLSNADGYIIGYTNFVNLAQKIGPALQASYGNRFPQGTVKVKLHMRMLNGTVYEASAGWDGDFDGPLTGDLNGAITDWVSMKTFDAFDMNQCPPAGDATLTITKI
jgi:hypothetical protein